MIFIPGFFEPQSHWSRAPLRPPSANQGARRARRELPLGESTMNSAHTGRISPHLRFSNPSVHLQLRQRENENGDPPGRNLHARSGKASPTG